MKREYLAPCFEYQRVWFVQDSLVTSTGGEIDTPEVSDPSGPVRPTGGDDDF